MSMLEYFGLNEEPFRISPNPRFLFLNEQVKEASSNVSYMTKHRTAPLYMYGAIGSGKPVFCAAYMKSSKKIKPTLYAC
jgi:general secretion pathway protein A